MAAGGMFPTSRLEAFSDGVFAIAITLLVLDLHVPERLEGRSLAAALGHQWPAYFAYLVSFAVIGIIWVNHHVLCTLVARANRPVLFANLFLLLMVSVLPFPTRLIADYLTRAGSDSHTAAAVYSVNMLLVGAAFTVLFQAVVHDAALVHHPLAPDRIRAAARRFSGGGLLYLVAVGISFVSAVATLAVHAALAVYYCFDHLAPIRNDADPDAGPATS